MWEETAQHKNIIKEGIGDTAISMPSSFTSYLVRLYTGTRGTLVQLFVTVFVPLSGFDSTLRSNSNNPASQLWNPSPSPIRLLSNRFFGRIVISNVDIPGRRNCPSSSFQRQHQQQKSQDHKPRGSVQAQLA